MPQHLVLLPFTSNFPLDILRLIFEAAVRLAQDDATRQRIAFSTCLVSKHVKNWTERFLYIQIALFSQNQAMQFASCFKIKDESFLARSIRSLVILTDVRYSAAFSCLFLVCRSLQHIICFGSSHELLQALPFSNRLPLQVILIKATGEPHQLAFRHSIHHLHLFDPSAEFGMGLDMFSLESCEEDGYTHAYENQQSFCIEYTGTPTDDQAQSAFMTTATLLAKVAHTFLPSIQVTWDNNRRDETSVSWSEWVKFRAYVVNMDRGDAVRFIDIRPEACNSKGSPKSTCLQRAADELESNA